MGYSLSTDYGHNNPDYRFCLSGTKEAASEDKFMFLIIVQNMKLARMQPRTITGLMN